DHARPGGVVGPGWTLDRRAGARTVEGPAADAGGRTRARVLGAVAVHVREADGREVLGLGPTRVVREIFDRDRVTETAAGREPAVQPRAATRAHVRLAVAADVGQT